MKISAEDNEEEKIDERGNEEEEDTEEEKIDERGNEEEEDNEEEKKINKRGKEERSKMKRIKHTTKQYGLSYKFIIKCHIIVPCLIQIKNNRGGGSGDAVNASVY